MSESDLTARLREAITHINAGRRKEARIILLALSREYPNAEQVWMWLAASADDNENRTRYLRRALQINPRNEKARSALAELTGEPLPQARVSQPDWVSSPREPGTAAPRAYRSSRQSSGNTVIIAVLALIALILVIFTVSAAVRTLFAPTPTSTPLPTLAASSTPSPGPSPTPSITPGGPTLTPIPIGGTLPASWTPIMTATTVPSNTPAPTFTPLPSNTPSATAPVRPTVTRVPTITPGGPTFTPKPTRLGPTVSPSGTPVTIRAPLTPTP